MNKGIKTPDFDIQLARDMRNNLTPGERLLWEWLESKQFEGYKFRCQHPIYRYILDFYCDEKLLAIEVDGNVHKEIKDFDEYRDDFLKSFGIQTMRFDNDEFMNNINSVIDAIKKELSV